MKFKFTGALLYTLALLLIFSEKSFSQDIQIVKVKLQDPGSFSVGNIVSIQTDIRLQKLVNKSFDVSYYLSPDNQFDATDLKLATEVVKSGSSVVSTEFQYTITKSVPEGKFYVVVRADYKNLIKELNEKNNLAISAESIDIIITTKEEQLILKEYNDSIVKADAEFTRTFGANTVDNSVSTSLLSVAVATIESDLISKISIPSTFNYYVATNGSDANPGTETQPFLHVQRAINVAMSGQTIKVNPGRYVENLNFNGKYLGLYGSPENPELTILDGGGDDRVITYYSTAGSNPWIVAGFVIQNGNGFGAATHTGHGGGIYIFGSAYMTVYSCILRNNSANVGAAADARHTGCLTLENVLIYDNTAVYGSAFYIYNVSKVTLLNVTIGNNNDNSGYGQVYLQRNAVLAEKNCINWTTSSTYEVQFSSATSSSTNGPCTASFDYTDINTSKINKGTSGFTMTVNTNQSDISLNPSFTSIANYLLNSSSPCINRGDVASEYNDVKFPPSQGTVVNDIGYTGGPSAFYSLMDLSFSATGFLLNRNYFENGEDMVIDSRIISSNMKNADFAIHYFLSTNNTYSTDDIPIGSHTKTGVESGNVDASFTYSVGNINAGQYYVLVYLDKVDAYSESNESNNIGVAGMITIISTPTAPAIQGGGEICPSGGQVGIDVDWIDYQFFLFKDGIPVDNPISENGVWWTVTEAGTYTMSFKHVMSQTYHNVPGKAAVSLITIPEIPGTISGEAYTCINSLYTYSIENVPGATSYLWNITPLTGSTIVQDNSTSIIASFSSPGVYRVWVTSVNCAGTSETQSIPVFVIGAPSAPQDIKGPVCVATNLTDNAYTLTPAFAENPDSYLWSVSKGLTITSGQGTTSITVSTDTIAGLANVSVMAVNCSLNSSVVNYPVTIKGRPSTPQSISGPEFITPNSTNIIYTAIPANGETPDSYIWTVPEGMIITSGQGTATITVSTGTKKFYGYVSVEAVNCDSLSSDTTAILIKCFELEIPIGAISGKNRIYLSQGINFLIEGMPIASDYRRKNRL